MAFKEERTPPRFLPAIVKISAQLGAYKVEITPGEREVRVIAYTERGSREFMRLSKGNYLSLLLEAEEYIEKGIKEIRVDEAVFPFSLSFFPSQWGDQVIINFRK